MFGKNTRKMSMVVLATVLLLVSCGNPNNDGSQSDSSGSASSSLQSKDPDASMQIGSDDSSLQNDGYNNPSGSSNQSGSGTSTGSSSAASSRNSSLSNRKTYTDSDVFTSEQPAEEGPSLIRPDGSFDTTLTIDITKISSPISPLLAGNNIQWPQNGDGVLNHNTNTFNMAVVNKMVELSPTVLRYPGGTHADSYNWRAGIGSVSERQKSPSNGNSTGSIVYFGTNEYLELCARLDAEPLITVNIITGTVQDAVDWLRYCNEQAGKTQNGFVLPKVKYWEIGNEPYLEENHLPSAQYVTKANEFIAALKAADPTIHVMITSRNAEMGGFSGYTYDRNFMVNVMNGTRGISQAFNSVAIHNGYFPFDAWYPNGSWPDKTVANYTDEEYYKASMVAYMAIDADIKETRRIMTAQGRSTSIKYAITEFSPLYTLVGSGAEPKNNYINTLGGLLYTADALRYFSTTDEVFMANYWSISSNWYFGAISGVGIANPNFYALRTFRRMLSGNRVDVTANTTVFSTARSVGYTPKTSNVPTIATSATYENGKIRLMVINKDYSRKSYLAIKIPGASKINSIQSESIEGDKLFSTNIDDIRIKTESWNTHEGDAQIIMQPHSLMYVEITVTR